MICGYIRDYYNVPAEIGRRVTYKGRWGIIAEDRGNYIGVNFDDDKPGEISTLHPTWEVSYHGLGEVRQMTRSQKRYREFKEADWFTGTFREWLSVH